MPCNKRSITMFSVKLYCHLFLASKLEIHDFFAASSPPADSFMVVSTKPCVSVYGLVTSY